jgi:hypothetical protein
LENVKMQGDARDNALFSRQDRPTGPFLSGHRLLLCSILMATACALASLVFTCATPFAALAAYAAVTLPLPSALVAVSGTWLLNQAIGYGLVAYPISADSMAWGAALGAASLVATVAAGSLSSLPGLKGSLLGYAYGLAAAFGAYELCLIAVGILLGSLEAFTPAIVTRIALLNVVAFVALAVIWHLGARLATNWKSARSVPTRVKLRA